MRHCGQVLIGFKHGMAVYVSELAIDQLGMREVKEQLGMTVRHPVKTNLSGNTVMVEADSHEQAVQKYLNRRTKEQGK